MAIPSLPEDFKEFLKLLGSNGIEYLLIGGYAVNVGSSRVDLQACKLEYSIVSPK